MFLVNNEYLKILIANFGAALTADQVSAAEDILSKQAKIEVVKNQFVIPIAGLLTEKPDFFAAFFGVGNTTYESIRSAINEANANSDIDSILLDVDYSPGGYHVGLINTMLTVANSKKPVFARVKNGAYSAAYMLISQSKEISARNLGAGFGSVGVAIDTYINDNELSLTNSDSPNKRPDLKTDDGKQIVVEQLDAAYNQVIELMSEARGLSIKYINENFGKGASLTANDALKRKMIDRVDAITEKPAAEQGSGAKKMEVKKMDLTQLKAEFPEIYAAAVQIGVSQERDRVLAHVNLGIKKGASDIAIKAIEDGDDLTQTLIAQYISAGVAVAAIEARESDNVDDVSIPDEKNAVDDFDAKVSNAFDEEKDESVVTYE